MKHAPKPLPRRALPRRLLTEGWWLVAKRPLPKPGFVPHLVHGGLSR